MPNNGSAGKTLEALARRLGRVLANVPPLGARISFDLGADGRLFVDAHHQPPVVSHTGAPADCTLSMRIETLERILSGDLDGTTAFMQGEMTISGDVELAVRLNELLAEALSESQEGTPRG